NSYGTGRRKQAIARVRIVPGTGKWTINGRSLDAYFPNKVHQQIVSEPFAVLGAEDAFDVIARIDGGGVTGQAGALRMGLARALALLDVEVNRPPLKKAGFLTRDARATERKKYGLKKARKAPQYSKRLIGAAVRHRRGAWGRRARPHCRARHGPFGRGGSCPRRCRRGRHRLPPQETGGGRRPGPACLGGGPRGRRGRRPRIGRGGRAAPRRGGPPRRRP